MIHIAFRDSPRYSATVAIAKAPSSATSSQATREAALCGQIGLRRETGMLCVMPLRELSGNAQPCDQIAIHKGFGVEHQTILGLLQLM